MKKLMLLGGSRYLLPVIEAAHKLGLYVITCDYLPDNMAHKYADEYCNISIIEKDAVLECAVEHQIDGIMSFACDPGVVTAAYVAEKMGLPHCEGLLNVDVAKAVYDALRDKFNNVYVTDNNNPENLSVAVQVGREVLSLPLYGDLGEDAVRKICEILKRIGKQEI